MATKRQQAVPSPPRGELFFFTLHAPDHFIMGGDVFNCVDRRRARKTYRAPIFVTRRV